MVFISIVFQFIMTWIPSREETLKSHDSHVLIGCKRRLYIFYEFIMCKFWSSLISEISYLQLRTLDLSGNRIVSLPVELRFMTSVVNLNLGENPLTCPLANVRILASWSPKTIPILCQHIFGLFQTHPPYVSIDSTERQQILSFFWQHSPSLFFDVT